MREIEEIYDESGLVVGSAPKAFHPLTVDILAELKTAIKVFGTYQFDDRGPHEVMDISVLVNRLRNLSSATEAADVILEVYNTEDERSQSVAQILMQSLDDWDELFADERIEDCVDLY